MFYIMLAMTTSRNHNVPDYNSRIRKVSINIHKEMKSLTRALKLPTIGYGEKNCSKISNIEILNRVKATGIPLNWRQLVFFTVS